MNKPTPSLKTPSVSEIVTVNLNQKPSHKNKLKNVSKKNAFFLNANKIKKFEIIEKKKIV